MPILNPNSTSYEHPWEPNLSDLHNAMEYNAQGEPVIRTTIQGLSFDGNVFVDHVEISNDAGNPVPVSANTGTNTSENPIYTAQAAGTIHHVKYADSDNMQLDATERLRVSQSYDTWWYAPTVDKDGDLRYIESYAGTGAGSAFVQNLSSISLSSGSDASGTFTRISRRRHKMRPTVSIRSSFSVNWNGYDSNVVKRAGLFTSFNGTFFQVGADLSIVLRRRLADGTLVERVIPRTEFNNDALDGTTSVYDLRPNSPHTFTVAITGYNGITTLDVSGVTMYNVSLMVADRSKFFPGLKGRITGVSPSTFNQVTMVAAVSGTSGPGVVTFTMLQDPGVFTSVTSAVFKHDYLFHQLVFGFDFNGNRNTAVRYFVNGMFGRQVVHIEQFGDTLSSPWSNAPAVSSRYEIFNNSAPGYRPSLLVSSETVTLEAPVAENPAHGVAARNNYIAFAAGGTAEYPVLGVGLRPGEPYQRVDLQLQSIDIADTNNWGNQNTVPATFYWKIVLNPSIGGTLPTPTNVGRASRQWEYTTANTASGGITLFSGYTSSHSGSINIAETFKDINLGSNIDYTDADRVVLVIKQLNGGTNEARVYATINFVELL